MGIKRNYDQNALFRQLGSLPRRLVDRAVETLCYVGESAVNTARSLPHPPEGVWMEDDGTVRTGAWGADMKTHKTKYGIPPHQPNYIDWTANLRSSIGYVVVVDGEIVNRSSFEPVKDGEEGSRKGIDFAEELASRVPVGKLALILVAGMHYAAYVQSKGYDVLNSAVITADEMATRMLASLRPDTGGGLASV